MATGALFLVPTCQSAHLHLRSCCARAYKPLKCRGLFPKNWQTANYNGWDEASAEENLESFGNKIVLETKIQAGNGYFLKKKVRYRSSKSVDVLELTVLDKADWLRADIVERDAKVTKKIVDFFKENIATAMSSS